MESVGLAPADDIAERLEAIEALRQITIQDQPFAAGGEMVVPPSTPAWTLEGVARIRALRLDVELILELDFSSGERLVCRGNLGGFGFCDSGSAFRAHCLVPPAELLKQRIGFAQVAIGSWTGEITLWQGGELVAVIWLAGLGAGAVGAAGTVSFAVKPAADPMLLGETPQGRKAMDHPQNGKAGALG